jgi:hypothetical protein
VQGLDVPAVADRDHPAVRTAGQIGVGLDVQHHQTLSTANVGIAGDVEDVHALHAEQLIGPSAPQRARTTRAVTHARPSLDSVAWSLLILEGLAPSRPRATPWTRTPRDGSPRLIYESQKKSDGDVENP